MMIPIDLGHDVELRHLEHFVTVAEESSFTRAAARLHLVQSTLSASIRSLERELGARLFDRSTHHVELTEAGRALLPEAQTVLADVEAARDAVTAAHGGLRGTVRVGIMHSLALIDVAGAMVRYRAERPQVQIVPKTALGGSAELAAQVADGNLDLAFVSLPGQRPPDLTFRELRAEPMLLVCAENDPLARRSLIRLTELDNERFVDFPVGWGNRAAVDRAFLQAGLHREIGVEVTDIPAAIELVRAGFGCAFLSDSMIRGSSTEQLALIRVQPEPRFEVSLVTPGRRRVSAAARAFIDLVLAAHPSTDRNG
jgi:DNA-binding transcriptional LysR family regulator